MPIAEEYTYQDMKRDLEFLEMDYRRFKADVYSKLIAYERYIDEQKTMLRLKLDADYKKST